MEPVTEWQKIWTRLSEGRHVVVEGAPAVPLAGPALRLVVVECDANPGQWGTLEEARRRLESVLTPHVASPITGEAPSYLRAELRRHLFGEPERLGVEQYFRSFIAAPVVRAGRVVLMLRGVDAADTESLELLTRLVREGGPALPLLLSFERAERSAAAQRLYTALCEVLPREAFWRLSAPPGGVPAAQPSSPERLLSLSPATLRVLRAAATLGDRFETEVLAQLLEVNETVVLEALQNAVDGGLAIEDRGQGIFKLEQGLALVLRESTLPSLARSWHERLAQMFGGPPAPAHAAPAAAADTCPWETNAPALRARDDAHAAPAADPSGASDPDGGTWLQPSEAEGEPPGDARREDWWQLLKAAVDSQAREQRAARGAAADGAGSGNARRAARHAEAASSWVLACERHIRAASIASRTGAHEAAFGHVADASRLAARVGDPELQRRAELASHVVSARAQWQSDSSLDSAESTLHAARALTSDRDPPELRVEIALLFAGVYYDSGTRRALEQALREVGLACRLLMDEGRPLDAARILNEEAAIWIKLGDPMRANHLLARSREVFAKLADVHAVARLELAETEHLLARLLLNARAKPGHERDVLVLAVARGRAAERAYEHLGDPLQLGRVWETLARLELRLGHVDTAARLLDDARALQRETGDAVGLARSSAAASDVLAAAREYPKALELLAQSVELNTQKHLRAGLEFNLVSLRQLQAQLPSELVDAARALERRLGDVLGAGAPPLAR